MVRRGVAISLLVALGACGKSAPPAPRDAGAHQSNEASQFVRDRFCDSVLPRAEVAKLGGSSVDDRTRSESDGPGVATCLYESGPEGEPSWRVHLMVDCRPQSLDVARLREMARSMAGDDGEFQSIELGTGGAKAWVPRMKARSIAFVHASVPCAVSISVEPGTSDVSDALAAIVERRLGPGTRPR